MGNYKELLKYINTFIFDYDGVLTDGTILMTDKGEAYRISNVKDGYALQLAIKKGYRIAVISGAHSESMLQRLKSVQVTDVFLGVENKLDVYKQYLVKYNLGPEQVLYMGDDIPDYEVMSAAGVSACPADASEEIKAVAQYISHLVGGKGCVRDVI
jgi:3-deoxy-D-manno-octulosonate 8-phosphate phosphatase (KDO 8-P phosphatase)